MRYDVGRFRRPMRRSTEGQLMSLISLGDGSTLTLDFTTGQLDPRLTFTRGSNATFINSSGLVQYADANMMRNSSWSDSNPVPTSWSGAGNTPTIPATGSRTFTVTTAANSYIAEGGSSATGSQGLIYTAAVEVTAVSGSPTYNNTILATASPTGVSWYRNGTPVNGTDAVQTGVIAYVFTSGSGSFVRVGLGASGGTVTNQSITMTKPRLMPGNRVDSPYFPSASATNQYQAPRFDHDPTTGSPRGLLIEGAATNLVLNGSMAYTATAPTSWVRGFSGCTVASVDSTTFLGQKAWSIAATASGQRDLLEQVISLAANTTYTVSVYLEAVTGTPATFAYMTSLPAGATSGTVVNPSAGRVSFTVTVGATAGNGTLRIGIGTASGTGVSADASVRFSHVQVEAGSGASSYIPTGASQGSRQADHCTMPTSSFITGPLYPQTLFVECIPATPSAAFPDIVRLFDRTAGGTFNYGNEIYYFSAATMSVQRKINSSSGTDRALASGLAYNTRHKFATAINSSSFLGSYDGLTGSGATTAAAALASQVTHLGVGCNGDATPVSVMFGTVRQIKFFPFAMAQAQLNALTTL